MAKTKGGLSASPSSAMPRLKQSAIGGATSPPAQDSTVPPSEGGTPSQCRYPTRRSPIDAEPPTTKAKRPASRPPSKRAKFSGPGEPSQPPQAEPPTEDSQIPTGIPLETIIRRPMIAGPPIEGNLDCKERSFHSETWFDIDALKQQPELRDSFHCYRGIIGARHIAEALHVPYEPVSQADFREWSPFSQRDMVHILSRGNSIASVLTRRELPSGMLLIDVLLRANIFPLQHKVQRRGTILKVLFRISEGYYFGPHHLIMTSLLHFEEKVHQRKLQREDVILLLFPRLLCQILEHLGYPAEPHLERRCIAERPSLSTNGITLAAYFAPQGAPDGAPPVVLATSASPPLSKPTITVSLTEFRGLVHSLQTLSTAQDSLFQSMATICAHQDQIIATQTQHTTILHQIQQHLSMQTLPGHDRFGPSEPSLPDEGTIPAEQPISDEEIRAEPSHDPITI
ncbi:hypothetical protein CK203_060843 [Vitis vinifera]|uniref:Uncharacterized protein n=1 Tax=Vitis vinifera TaxID=29760 RepID=A0A438FUD2_VITVI|nr:hypothetical protein CK203_060843 [Vitis vinifera]